MLSSVLNLKVSWLSEALTLLSSWRSGLGFLCCSRSATAQLIVRQRGVATELTSTIPSAVPMTENLECTMNTYLPPGDSLCTTLSSPQFSQALSMFWSALQSGQAGPVVRQFGLGPDAVNAAAGGNLEEFITALETEAKSGEDEGQDDKSKNQPPQGGSSSDKKDDDDEGMALD